MRAVDLFAGAGNASQGLHEAGYDVLGYEYWEPAQRSHEANGLPCHLHDLSDPTRDDEIPTAPLYWASPPCQPFSAAGDGEGEFDDRDGFPWLLRILALRRPAVVILENVRGLVFERHEVYFHGILRLLRNMGYDVQWKILNSADVGVPQTRERVFIVCRLDGGPIVWPMITHTEEPGMFTEKWVSMATALAWQPDDIVGFPRRTDGNGDVLVLDGVEYRDRDLFPADGPSQAVTEKGRSWNRWQVRAGNDTNATVRSVDEPAPTVLARKDPDSWTLERLTTGSQGIVGDHASAHQAHTGEVLRVLRDEAGTEAFAQWALGVLDSLQSAEVLRPSVCWTCTLRGSGTPDAQPGPSTGSALEGDRSVRALWEAGERRASSGWQPAQQRLDELAAHLSKLPCERAQAPSILLGLWATSGGARTLQQALAAVEALGRPTCREDQPALATGPSPIRVSITELAVLQDFVDGWVFHGTRTDQARQVGNACPRRLARLLAEANRPV